LTESAKLSSKNAKNLNFFPSFDFRLKIPRAHNVENVKFLKNMYIKTIAF